MNDVMGKVLLGRARESMASRSHLCTSARCLVILVVPKLLRETSDPQSLQRAFSLLSSSKRDQAPDVFGRPVRDIGSGRRNDLRDSLTQNLNRTEVSRSTLSTARTRKVSTLKPNDQGISRPRPCNARVKKLKGYEQVTNH